MAILEAASHRYWDVIVRMCNSCAVFNHFSVLYPVFIFLVFVRAECVTWVWTSGGTVSAPAPPAAPLHYSRGISSLACRRWLRAVEHQHPLSRDSLLAPSSLFLSPCLSPVLSLMSHSCSCHNICSCECCRDRRNRRALETEPFQTELKGLSGEALTQSWDLWMISLLSVCEGIIFAPLYTLPKHDILCVTNVLNKTA